LRVKISDVTDGTGSPLGLSSDRRPTVCDM
jgi:hypothetical protein